MERGTERSTSILARNPSKMNPLYPGHRIAANAGYKVGAVKETRRAGDLGTHTPRRSLFGPRPTLPDQLALVVMGPCFRRDDGCIYRTALGITDNCSVRSRSVMSMTVSIGAVSS